MVSERYFLFGIEEMGEAISSVKPKNIPLNVIETLVQSIQSGKIQKSKVLELLSAFINSGLLGPLVSDPELGDHIEAQFISKSGKRIIIESDFIDPITVQINGADNLVSFSVSEIDQSIPIIKIKLALVQDILSKDDISFLKYVTLPPDNPLAVGIPEKDREYLADMIVRIFLAVATSILMRDHLREKIKNNIHQFIQSLASSTA